MNQRFHPYHEPLRETLVRTISIALVVGLVISLLWGGISRWPAIALLALWPSLGGHFVELGFLNGLRPRLPAARGVQVLARVAIWFAGGVVLVMAMNLTAAVLFGLPEARWLPWWLGGCAFIGIELTAHLALLIRRRPNFYDGLG